MAVNAGGAIAVAIGVYQVILISCWWQGAGVGAGVAVMCVAIAAAAAAATRLAVTIAAPVAAACPVGERAAISHD
jgi:hypothetical protein